jgi:hypothetical protein
MGSVEHRGRETYSQDDAEEKSRMTAASGLEGIRIRLENDNR